MASTYDKASLVLIPSGTKESLVFSQKPTNGDGDFTFSRSTSATRVNADGLIEKETQNLLLQSNSFDTTWTINGTGTLTSGQTGYDGTNDAWLLTKSAAATYLSQNTTLSAVNTFSVYVKAGTNTYIALYIRNANQGKFFNLANGTIGSDYVGTPIDAKIEDVGNGWYRCSVTTDDASNNCRIYPADDDGNVSGTSGNIYIQDAQLEQGLVARDYIETTTSAVYGGITDNIPRLDYNGSCPSLLLEPQRTNLVSQSEYMQYSNNVNVSVTDNDATSPEGLDNAAKAVPTTTNSNHIVRSNNLAGLTSQGTYSVSVFAKQNGYKYINVGAGFGSTATPLPTFDLNTGTIVANSSNGTIEDYGNGWYKCTAIIQIASTALYPIIGILNNSQSGSYAGDGASAVYLYGHQIENGSYATSYIPTYGSAVTAAEDSASNLNSFFAGLTNMAWFIDYTLPTESSSGFRNQFGYRDSSNADFYMIQFPSSNTHEFRYRGVTGVNVDMTPSIDEATYGLRRKIAYTKNGTTLKVFCNGVEVSSVTNANATTFSTTDETLRFSSSFDIELAVNKTLLFSTALTDEEAIALTQV